MELEYVVKAVGVVLLGLFGVYIVLKPMKVSGKLNKFYGNYPIVRYAKDEQLRSRKPFILAVGVIFIVLALIGALSLFQGIRNS